MALEQISFEFNASAPADEKIQEEIMPVEKTETLQKPEIILVDEAEEKTETPVTAIQEELVPLKSTRGRKSLKDIELTSQFIKVPEDDILLQRHYYSITEVAQMFHVNPSLLRFWESEFPVQLRLRKNKKGDRFFTPQDIKMVEQIWFLLRERKLTIEGARDFLKKNKKLDEKFTMIQNLQKLKNFLLEMRATL